MKTIKAESVCKHASHKECNSWVFLVFTRTFSLISKMVSHFVQSNNMINRSMAIPLSCCSIMEKALFFSFNKHKLTWNLSLGLWSLSFCRQILMIPELPQGTPNQTSLPPLYPAMSNGSQFQDYMAQFTQNTKIVKKPKQKFTQEEDDALMLLYQQYGNDWKMISAILKNRTPRQCRDRWKNYLSPNVSKTPWTTEDDLLLYQKFLEFGRQWAIIAKYFPGRTDIHIKNRWATISKQFEQHNQQPNMLQQPMPTQQEIQTMQPQDHSNPMTDMINLPQPPQM